MTNPFKVIFVSAAFIFRAVCNSSGIKHYRFHLRRRASLPCVCHIIFMLNYIYYVNIVLYYICSLSSCCAHRRAVYRKQIPIPLSEEHGEPPRELGGGAIPLTTAGHLSRVRLSLGLGAFHLLPCLREGHRDGKRHVTL